MFNSTKISQERKFIEFMTQLNSQNWVLLAILSEGYTVLKKVQCK